MAAESKATTSWEGDLAGGRGTTSTESGTLSEVEVTWPARVERTADTTSPEELLAAAHASCFTMSLSKRVADAGGTPEKLETTATVTLDLQAAKITKVALTTRGTVDGLDEAGFKTAAQTAKDACFVSKLFGGNTEITLDAALA